MNNKLKLTLGTTLAATLAVGATLALADNPFSAQTVEASKADSKASSEMKCGAGMCGGNMGAAKSADTCPADADKDGKVTKDEFIKHHEAMFTEADANKDGALDADERKTLHSKMAEGKCGASQ